MMHILFDTNVILDVLLNREPWVQDSSALWRASDEGRIVGYAVASTFTDIFYIARRIAGKEKARSAIRICLDAFVICPVNREALERAEAMGGDDFEDNLQAACAELMGLDAIATRNVDDFRGSSVQAFTPADILSRLRRE